MAAHAPDVYGALPPTLRERALEDVGECLRRRLTADEQERFAATYAIVSGLTARQIVEYADERHIDLIVMGTHGRSGVAHLLIGSVAEHVVRTATCPVLTVRVPALPARGSPSRQPAPRGSRKRRSWLQAELLDAVPHLVAVDAQQLRRLRLVAAGALERLHQELPLDLVEVHALGRQPELRRARPSGSAS